MIANLRDEIGENEDIDQEIRDKVEQVFEDNRGLAQMFNVQECITTGVMQNLPNNWNNDDVLKMKFAPMSCADVERSFSIYKAYYRRNRQSFELKTLCQHIVINYNETIGEEDDNIIDEDSDMDE